MLEINAEKFVDQPLLPPCEEFPLGFGIQLLPESGSPLDLESWTNRSIANIVSATRKWGALVIPKVIIEPEYYYEGSFIRARDTSWGQVPQFQLQWSWHSDPTPQTIILGSLAGKPGRKLATGVAPTSLVDRAIQEQAYQEAEKEPQGQFTDFFRNLSAEKYRYSDGSRIKKIDEQFWPDIRDYDLARKLKAFYLNMNNTLKRRQALWSHDWVANPGSALLVYNENKMRPHQGISTTVHCCLLDPSVTDLGGDIWKKEI